MFMEETIATVLDDEMLVDYRPTSGGGDCFVNVVPPSPDACVTITALGGEHEYTFAGGNEAISVFQIRVRGAKNDQQTVRDRLQAIITSLNTLGMLPGVWAEGSTYEASFIWARVSTPYLRGWDENNRGEWACRLTVRYPTV